MEHKQVAGFSLVNGGKVERVERAFANPTTKPDRGMAAIRRELDDDDFALLVCYDRLGGLIRDEEGDPVPTGAFWDFDNDQPRDGFPKKVEANATEAARELAEENGINLREVEGSGQDGKVLKKDVEELL